MPRNYRMKRDKVSQNATRFPYNPDRDLVHLHTNGTPNRCEATLSLW